MLRVKFLKHDEDLNKLWHVPLGKILDVCKVETKQCNKNTGTYKYYYVNVIAKYGDFKGKIEVIRVLQSEVKVL